MSWDHNLEDDTLAHADKDSTVPSMSTMKPELEQYCGSHFFMCRSTVALSRRTWCFKASAWTAPLSLTVLSGCADTGFYHRAAPLYFLVTRSPVAAGRGAAVPYTRLTTQKSFAEPARLADASTWRLPSSSAPTLTCQYISPWECKRPQRPTRARQGAGSDSLIKNIASIVAWFFSFILKLEHVCSCILNYYRL